MSESLVLSETEGAVCHITLNRPDRLNSLNEEMLDQLASAVTRAGTSSKIRCVHLGANGKVFSAGQDLGDFLEPPPAERVEHLLKTYYNPIVTAIMHMDKPVLCSVNGEAAGATTNIALACDITIAARSAGFSQPFNRIALIPDAGGTWILPRLVGHQRAAALTLLGERIPAEKAEAWGLIWQCVDDNDLQAHARQMALRLAAGPTSAQAYNKRLLQLSWSNSPQEQLQQELHYQKAAASSSDFAEGLQAFFAKRAPDFHQD